MARLSIDFFSDVLELGTSASVVWPQHTEHQIGVSGGADLGARDVPVLYLLHGLSDDHTAWARNTSIERYAVARGVAVVMPAANRSFYTDEVHGQRYWTFLTEELPRMVAATFRVSQRREDTFVAGLSMGGYGAMKWALREPGRFAAAASLSGALDIDRLRQSPDTQDIYERAFGGTPEMNDDVFALLGSADPSSPRLYVSCGTDDTLLAENHRFTELAASRGIDVTVTWPGGGHDWALWDAEIERVLDWLPLRSEG